MITRFFELYPDKLLPSNRKANCHIAIKWNHNSISIIIILPHNYNHKFQASKYITRVLEQNPSGKCGVGRFFVAKGVT